MLTIEKISELLKSNSKKQTIIFPEGEEEKIQTVANILVERQLAKPIIIVQKKSSVQKTLNSNVEVIVMEELDKTNFINEFMNIRKDKTNLEQATKVMNIAAYVGAMYVKLKLADAMLCGITFTTADTLRPALQIIKTSPSVSLAASVFIMRKDDVNVIFTDCALNIKPTSQQLADITKMTVNFAKKIQVKNPEAALLSYSTAGSGAGEDVDRVRQAVEILENEKVDFSFGGEIQFDAAWDKEIRDKKFKNSKLTKKIPDIFVFPDINSGNIGYKIAQRMGGYEAVGPFILGLNQPVNDLSRGATLEDILNTAIMTIYQSQD